MLTLEFWNSFVALFKITRPICAHLYDWDEPRNRFRVTQSKTRWIMHGILTTYIFVDSFIYLTIALNTATYSAYTDFIANYGHWISRCAVSVINIIVLFNLKSFEVLMNTLIAVFNKELKDDARRCSQGRRFNALEVYSQTILYAALIQPIAVAIAYFKETSSILYWHSSAFPPGIYLWITPFFGIWEYWISVHSFFMAAYLGNIMILTFHTQNEWLSNLSKSTEFTTETVLEYRSIQILSQICNDCTGILWTFSQALVFICLVFSSCGSMSLFHEGKIQFFSIFFGFVVLFWFVLLSYPVAGQLNETSLAYRKRTLSFAGRNTPYARSFRQVAIYVWQFYAQKRETTFTFLLAVVNYTVTVLMMKIV